MSLDHDAHADMTQAAECCGDRRIAMDLDRERERLKRRRHRNAGYVMCAIGCVCIGPVIAFLLRSLYELAHGVMA